MLGHPLLMSPQSLCGGLWLATWVVHKLCAKRGYGKLVCDCLAQYDVPTVLAERDYDCDRT